MAATYRISHEAARDLRAIYRHSRRTWGRDQAVKYAGELKHCFALLTAHPEAGKRRPELYPPGLYSFPQGRHLVFYRHESNGILIIRVLHGRQDVAAILKASDAER